MLIDLLFLGAGVSALILMLIGALTVLYWFRKPKSPSDDTNRLNNIASWWIGLTRPEVLAKSYKYFRQDVMKNITDVESTNRLDG